MINSILLKAIKILLKKKLVEQEQAKLIEVHLKMILRPLFTVTIIYYDVQKIYMKNNLHNPQTLFLSSLISLKVNPKYGALYLQRSQRQKSVGDFFVYRRYHQKGSVSNFSLLLFLLQVFIPTTCIALSLFSPQYT